MLPFDTFSCQGEAIPKVLDTALVPSSVVCLSATDNALMQRFLDLTEEEAEKYSDQVGVLLHFVDVSVSVCLRFVCIYLMVLIFLRGFYVCMFLLFR